MTPAARVAAAIEILDAIFDGSAAEPALTGWGRRHRFAGSKDRAAIRDHVFQALRCRASYGWLGGSQSGRGVMLGAMRAADLAEQVFTAEGYAPDVVQEGEGERPLSQADRHIRFDMPDWLLPHFDTALGDGADRVLEILKDRAGVFLRVNEARTTTMKAIESLAGDGVVAVAVSDINCALQVVENERRVAQSTAYISGMVELQDPSSQQAMRMLGIKAGQRVLDLCAGGGGKALAMAAMGADVTAHDIDVRRMADIEPRAQRAGVTIQTVETRDLATLEAFDLVLVDAPCSGSGTWRRAPMAKWELTPDRLQELTTIQDKVLEQAAAQLKVNGTLAYATCSVFEVENRERIQAFLARRSSFKTIEDLQLYPRALGDGFFLSVLHKVA